MRLKVMESIVMLKIYTNFSSAYADLDESIMQVVKLGRCVLIFVACIKGSLCRF